VLKLITPESTVLQQYIEGFYLYRCNAGSVQSHIAFPHVNTGLSFFKGVSVTRQDHILCLNEQEENGYSIELLGKYTQPVRVHCVGAIDEIAIVFKPLGISRFVREDFGQLAPDFSQSYNNPNWMAFAQHLYETNNRITALEEFLLGTLVEKEEFTTMELALALFESPDADNSVTAVADMLNMNLKTFQRNFAKMLACSPVDYKRIAKFRNSLRSKFQAKEIKSLTNITYEANYSDQSYFIREFKKLTRQNPRHFFRDAKLIDGDKIVWEII
jgi:AraC-like DNA-binding protein